MIFSALWPGEGVTGTIPEPVSGNYVACGDYVVCADGGYAACSAAGIRPAAVIGDFDSLSAALIKEIEELGIERVVYSCDKDDTDMMLCVKYGLARGFGRFLIIGGIGGDFGHTIANLQVLSFLMDMKCEASIVTVRERILMAGGEAQPASGTIQPDVGVAQPDGGAALSDGGADHAVPLVFTGRPGSRFSALSYTERCSGVCIGNAKYELSNAELTHSHPLGVSNEFINTGPVTVSVRRGRLLVIIDN